MKTNTARAVGPAIKNKNEVPTFELGQAVKIRCQDTNFEKRTIKTFEGDVIFANSIYVTIKGDKYKESFTIEQFRRGEVKLIAN